jgi:hypothetical protein
MFAIAELPAKFSIRAQQAGYYASLPPPFLALAEHSFDSEAICLAHVCFVAGVQTVARKPDSVANSDRATTRLCFWPLLVTSKENREG